MDARRRRLHRLFARVLAATCAIGACATVPAAERPANPSPAAIVQAQRVLEKALATASEIEEPGQRLWALRAIAEVWVLADRRRGRDVALDALRVAQSFPDQARRADGIHELLPLLAAVDPGKALEVARGMSSRTGTGSGDLEPVVLGLAKTTPQHAWQISSAITDAEQRRHALRALIYALRYEPPAGTARTAAAMLETLLAEGSARPAPTALGQQWFERAELISEAAELLATLDLNAALAAADKIDRRGDRDFVLGAAAHVLVKVNPARAVEIAERIASTRFRLSMMSDAAQALAKTDPKRSREVAEEALKLAQRMTTSFERQRALANAIPAVAATDPRRALNLCAGIQRFPTQRIGALYETARAAGSDPDVVCEAAAQIIHTTLSLTRGKERDDSMYIATMALGRAAVADPPRALALAAGITDEQWHQRALYEIVPALAKTHPDQALAMIQDAKDENLRAALRDSVVGVLADNDLHKAIELAESAGTQEQRDASFRQIAGQLAKSNPAAAEQVANRIADAAQRASALASVVFQRADRDPTRALAVARAMPDGEERSRGLSIVAGKLARTNVDDAVAVASSIADLGWRAIALSHVARALLTPPPEKRGSPDQG